MRKFPPSKLLGNFVIEKNYNLPREGLKAVYVSSVKYMWDENYTLL